MRREAVLRALEHNTGIFPYAPLMAAIAAQDEITLDLLTIVEWATREIDRVVADEAYIGHLHAFYLLAQFREQRAYPLIVKFFSIPGEVTLDVTGDFVTEDLGRVLASVSGGDMEPMRALAEDASANEYVCAAALDGMLCLFVEGVRPRREVIAALRSLDRGGLEREYSFAWDGLVERSTKIYPQELMEDIRRAFADGLVDDWHIDLDFVEEILERGKDATLARLRENKHYRFVEDAIAEMEWWACFDAPLRKVGRNEPCPCGSGLKVKHCCGSPRWQAMEPLDG